MNDQIRPLRSTKTLRVVTAESLNLAWKKYTELFGVEPHGTVTQLLILLEFAHDKGFVILPKGVGE